MSNVLIGIIGVILFIGLALAGALFLGPRFQESTNNSKASAAVQAVSQISSAANMNNVQGGTATQAGPAAAVTALATNGYLKSVPSNPVTGGGAPLLVADNAGAVSGDAAYVIMSIPTASVAICEAIARQSGQPVTSAGVVTDVATGGATLPVRPSGCAKITGTGTTAMPAGLYAYAAI